MQDGRERTVHPLAANDFRFCKEVSLEKVVAFRKPRLEVLLGLHLFRKQEHSALLEIGNGSRKSFGRVFRQVELDILDIRKERLDAGKDVRFEHDIVESELEPAFMVILDNGNHGGFGRNCFQDLQDKAIGIQRPENVVEKHFATAVDECLVVADQTGKSDIVQDVFENLGRFPNAVFDYGDATFRGIAKQELIGKDSPIRIEDRLTRKIGRRFHGSHWTAS